MASTATFTGDGDFITRYDISIAKGTSRNYLLTVEDGDVVSGKLVKSRSNLLGATIIFVLKADRESATEVLRLTSANSAEIEILTQSGSTLGQAVIKLKNADTDLLTPGVCYYYEVWVFTTDFRMEPVIDTSKFEVRNRIPVTLS